MADETVLRIKERIRQEMRDLLGVTMADGGSIDRQALPAQIDGVAHEVCADFGISDENWIGYIIKSTIDDFIGLGPLQPLQDDPKVAEIFIDPGRRRTEWNIYHAGRPRRSGRPDRRLPRYRPRLA